MSASHKTARLYVPSINEATHPRCCDEGYPDGPGRASNKEGESWVIILKPLSESIRQNCVMPLLLPMAAVAARCGFSGSSFPRRQRSESWWQSLQRNTVMQHPQKYDRDQGANQERIREDIGN